jgi:hypothetical protein
MATDNFSIIMGNNEDWLYPDAYVRFHPAAGNSYGRMYITCNYPLPQNPDYFTPFSGINEMGLCYDVFLHPNKPVFNSLHKPTFNGNLMSYCLQTCTSVSEVLSTFDLYNLAFMDDIQYFIVDATGDAAIIEGDDVIFKEDDFQVVTNFLQSDPWHGWYPCWRYDTAINMLENMTTLTRIYFRDICEATHQEGIYPTIYSNVFDLKNKIIDIYHYYDYNTKITFNLTDELSLGTHSYYLPSLFEPSNNQPPNKPSRPTGPPIGRVGREYTYSSTCSDPDNNILYYRFDWDDGTISPWYKQISSNFGQGSHSWEKPGTYEIRVKTKDIYGQEGEWSEPLATEMPKNQHLQTKPLLIVETVLKLIYSIWDLLISKIALLSI